MANLHNKLSETETKLFDSLLFNYIAETLNGMDKDTFMIKYEWYMVELRNKLILNNKSLTK